MKTLSSALWRVLVLALAGSGCAAPTAPAAVVAAGAEPAATRSATGQPPAATRSATGQPPVVLDAGKVSWVTLFGAAVAASGDTVAIGATGDDGGAVFIYRRVGRSAGHTWRQEAVLRREHMHFGSELALSGDVLAVGSSWKEPEPRTAHALLGSPAEPGKARVHGIVHIFRRNGADWVQEARLMNADFKTHEHDGQVLALSGDHLAVVARERSGRIYLFHRQGTRWVAEAPIQGDAGWSYVSNIALDGDTLAIAGEKRDASAAQVDVLRRTAERWQHEATFPVPTSFAGRSFDTVITTLGLSGDHLAIGAVPFVLGSGRRGVVHVHGRAGAAWTQQATLAGPHPAAENMFGRSVSLFRDTLAVNDSLGQSVHVFTRQGDTWTPSQRIDGRTLGAGTYFGAELALAADTLVIAAPGESPRNRSGTVYIGAP